jgi:hypothetical protein
MLTTQFSKLMIHGYIIAESIKPGSSLEGFPMTLTRVSRNVQDNATSDQPRVWTLIEFETTELPDRLADALAAVLEDTPISWYSHFTEGNEVFVAFPKRVFRYRRGDPLGRRMAQDYGQSKGVPQLDWKE